MFIRKINWRGALCLIALLALHYGASASGAGSYLQGFQIVSNENNLKVTWNVSSWNPQPDTTQWNLYIRDADYNPPLPRFSWEPYVQPWMHLATVKKAASGGVTVPDGGLTMSVDGIVNVASADFSKVQGWGINFNLNGLLRGKRVEVFISATGTNAQSEFNNPPTGEILVNGNEVVGWEPLYNEYANYRIAYLAPLKVKNLTATSIAGKAEDLKLHFEVDGGKTYLHHYELFYGEKSAVDAGNLMIMIDPSFPVNTTDPVNENITIADGIPNDAVSMDPETEYYFAVRVVSINPGYDIGGVSQPASSEFVASTASTRLAAPSDFKINDLDPVTGTSPLQHLLKMQWQDNSQYETAFSIYKSTDGTNFTRLNINNITASAGTGGIKNYNLQYSLSALPLVFSVTANSSTYNGGSESLICDREMTIMKDSLNHIYVTPFAPPEQFMQDPAFAKSTNQIHLIWNLTNYPNDPVINVTSMGGANITKLMLDKISKWEIYRLDEDTVGSNWNLVGQFNNRDKYDLLTKKWRFTDGSAADNLAGVPALIRGHHYSYFVVPINTCGYWSDLAVCEGETLP